MIDNQNDNVVILSQDIQNDYIKFYACMMQYLWDMRTVMNLANLEIAIFKRFPDKEEMENHLRLLETDIQDTIREAKRQDDEEFEKTFDKLKTSIENFNDNGYDIYQIEQKLDLSSIRAEGGATGQSDEPKKMHITVGHLGTK